MDKYHELLEASQESAGTAQRKYEAYQESIEAWTKKLQAAWEEFANNSNVQAFIKSLLKVSTGLVKAMPIIIKYASTFFTMLNAYKVPALLSTLGSFIGLGGNRKEIGQSFKRFVSPKEFYQKRAEWSSEQLESLREKHLSSIDSNVARIAGATTESASGHAESNKPINNKQNKTLATKAVTGIASGIMAGMTSSTQYKKDGVTYQMSGGTAALTQIATGAATGIASFFGGPLAGMIVQVLMNGLMPLVARLVESRKIAIAEITKEGESLKKSVDATKETLSDLNKVLKDGISIEDNESINEIKTALWQQFYSSEDLKTAIKEGNQEQIKLANDSLKTYRDRFDQILGQITNGKYGKLIDILNNDNLLTNPEVIRDLSIAADNLAAAAYKQSQLQTEEAAKAEVSKWAKKAGIDEWSYYDSDLQAEVKNRIDALEQQEPLTRKEQKQLNYLRNLQNALTDSITTTKTINRETDLLSAQGAIKNAQINGVDITSFSSYGYGKVGNDAIRRAIAEKLSLQANEIWIDEAAGIMTPYAKEIIDKAIKDNETLNNIEKSFTLSQVAVLPLSTDGKINQSNIDRQKLFAAALGIKDLNSEEGKDLIQKYGSLTLAELNETDLNKIFENIQKIQSSVEKIKEGSTKIVDIQKDVLKNYPELYMFMNDEQQLTEKLIEKTVQQSELALKKMQDEFLSDEKIFYEWVENLDDTNRAIVDNVLSSTGNIKSLDSLLEYSIINGEEEIIDLIEQSLEGLELTNDETKALTQTWVNYYDQLYDKEIKNLEEQKSAIQEITSQREYENKLIEARLKLENASKEKKRVWREGIGWVYEADQQKMAEAQKELEKVENEKIISKLDEQIKELQASKEILKNIEADESWKKLEMFANAWTNMYNKYADEQGLPHIDTSSAMGVKEGATSKNHINQVSGLASEAVQSRTKTKEALRKEALANLDMKTSSADDWAYKDLGNSEENRKIYNQIIGEYQQAYKNAEPYLTEEEKELYNRDYKLIENDKVKSYSVTLDSGKTYPMKDVSEGEIDAALKTTKYTSAFFDFNTNEWKFSGDKRWKNLSEYLNDIGIQKGNEILFYIGKGPDGKGGIKKGGGWYYGVLDKDGQYKYYFAKDQLILSGDFATDPQGAVVSKNALGNLSFTGGPSLINELGTEAIVTPQGTLTALPSKTGIVPADITSNLWELGELAPSFVHLLERYPDYLSGKPHASVNDESLNITNFTMNVDADDTFDVDAFVREVRDRVSLTKNKR